MQDGEQVQIFDRYWQGNFRVAAMTDGGKVYVERACELPCRDLRLVKPEEVRRAHN